MPLTVRSNGSTSANIITASWFNDYYNLLTGAMQDQEVTIKNNLVIQAIGGPPTAAMTAALAAATGLGIGAYVYGYTFASPDGESTISPTVSITTTSGNQGVNLSAVAVGPTGTTARKIYRTAVGGGTVYKLLTTISDNTTTTYNDRTADASLGATAPTAPAFGGTLVIKDQAGVIKFRIFNDGSFSTGGGSLGTTTITGNLTVTGTSSLDNGNLTTDGSGNISKVGHITNTITAVSINGTTSGTLTAYMDFRGTVKRVVLRFNNFKNGATTNTLILPVAFANGAHVSNGDHGGFTVNLSGGASASVNNQTAVGSYTLQTNITQMGEADIIAPFDRIVPALTNSVTHTGWTYIEGN